MFKYKNWSSS